MAEKTTYNGWTNYETWAVALWIDNEEGTQGYWRERAEEAYRDASADGTFTRRERAALDLANRLKEDLDENNPLSDTSTFYADLLNAALSEVNCYEIAENMLDDDLMAETAAAEAQDDPDA